MADPRCEYCDTPVAADANDCPECGAVLRASWERDDDEDEDETTTYTTVEQSSEAADGTTFDPTDGMDHGWTEGADPGGTDDPGSGAAGESDAGAAGGTDAGDSDDAGLLHPEGLLDDSLTVVVGAIGGILVGSIVAFWAAVTVESVWGLALGVLAWLGTTGYLMTRYRVTTAFAHGCYALALSLLLVPTVLFGPGAETGTFGDTVVGFLLFELFVGVVAAGIALVGYLVSRTEGGLSLG